MISSLLDCSLGRYVSDEAVLNCLVLLVQLSFFWRVLKHDFWKCKLSDSNKRAARNDESEISASSLDNSAVKP